MCILCVSQKQKVMFVLCTISTSVLELRLLPFVVQKTAGSVLLGSLRCHEYRVCFFIHDAIAKVLSILQSIGTELESKTAERPLADFIVAAGCAALASLALHDVIPQAIARHGGLPTVCRAVRCIGANPSVHEKACDFLLTVTANCDAARTAAGDAGAIDIVRQAMQQWPSNEVLGLCSAVLTCTPPPPRHDTPSRVRECRVRSVHAVQSFVCR